jgi:hypothetical protein
MSYQLIENDGIIGNMRTVVLVGMNGSIDWYCYPHFDSPSIFGAILDDKKGGRFQISADADGVRRKQAPVPAAPMRPGAPDRRPLTNPPAGLKVPLMRSP